jgi:hypothetical protein
VGSNPKTAQIKSARESESNMFVSDTRASSVLAMQRLLGRPGVEDPGKGDVQSPDLDPAQA